jgi:cyclopropane fatty-acyl-phospholipid synthase-like methyltransferase
MADTDAIRAFEHAGWERTSHSYEASFATATRQFIPPLLDAAEVAAGRSVLDVACGPGFVAAEAAGRGATVQGLDFSAASRSFAATLRSDAARGLMMIDGANAASTGREAFNGRPIACSASAPPDW